MILADIGWYQMISDGIGWYWLISDGICWHQMSSDDIRWYQMILAAADSGWYRTEQLKGRMAKVRYWPPWQLIENWPSLQTQKREGESDEQYITKYITNISNIKWDEEIYNYIVMWIPYIIKRGEEHKWQEELQTLKTLKITLQPGFPTHSLMTFKSAAESDWLLHNFNRSPYE